MKPTASSRGFTLVEVMVALVVFSIGVLGLVGLQGNAVRFSTDARNRADATFLADQLVARALISDPTTLPNFAHRPTGSPCAPTGSASTNAVVTGWLTEVAAALPNAAGTRQQVIVDAPNNKITVRLCWRNGSDGDHQLTVVNVLQR